MNSSISQSKQNLNPIQYQSPTLPAHQGRAFKLSLGHNNGPFLTKDIMHSNQNSTYLIAAKQILQSHQSMSKFMNVLNKEQEYQSKIVYNTFKVQNWFNKCQFMENQIKVMEKQIKNIAAQENKLKVEIKKCYARINRQNQQLQQGFLPLFRNLLKCIRDQNNDEKHLFQERKRDLEHLNTFRNSYLDQLVKCQRRMINMQEFLGLSKQQMP